MKKKGFTLVEMLAVIVLIAVLSVVAVSTYRGINESSKKKTLEAKIEQIESASEKWARENNITNRMTISVNNLVVEGYITADEVDPNGLAMIKNPVDGKNMICNTIELSFKEGLITSHFNNNDYNCKLANQSLEDSKIDVLVKSSSNDKLSGTSSIAKWTNKDVVLIINSTDYDSKATSISYDFEGSTITKNKEGLNKYTGTNFINEEAAKDYYNVYYVHSELLMDTKIVITYDIPGEGTKSRAYTIRFDKEEANATLQSNSEWLTVKDKAYITVDDGKGSGPAGIYYSQSNDKYETSSFKEAKPSTALEDLDVGRYYIWTIDNAGNVSSTYKMILEINNQDKTEPGCDVVFHGNKGQGHWYKKDAVTPGGVTTVEAGASGINVGVNMDQNNPVYTAFAAQGKINIEGLGEVREAETTRTGQPYYCHSKTLAGIYKNNTQTLWLDRTPPTVTLAQTSDTTYTQTKSFTIRVSDSLSGVNGSTTIHYGWAKAGEGANYSNSATTTATEGSLNPISVTVSGGGAGMTGTYYLHVDVSAVQDYAGNLADGINGQGTHAVFGPYKFDNTPPVCDGVGGKTNWTNGTYTVTQYCLDNAGTTDQSGCTSRFYTKGYTVAQNVRTDTIVIRDNAGNETTCPTNVYLEHIKPSCTISEPGPNGENGWYNSASVTLTASFQDNGAADLQSGLDVYGAAKTPNSTNRAQSVTFTENGNPLIAYGYVKDVAGNENTCQKTIKKDDGSEAIAGGCSAILGNSTWTNKGPIHYGVKLNTIPVSGCHESSTPWQGIWNSNCESMALTHVEAKTFSHSGYWVFATNSGILINCPGRTHNIYLDKTDPECSISKSNTGSTSGVTIKMTCTDNLSGCSGQTWTGVKSSGSHTVKDAAGNSCTKSYSVTSYTCNCSTCGGDEVEKCFNYDIGTSNCQSPAYIKNSLCCYITTTDTYPCNCSTCYK